MKIETLKFDGGEAFAVVDCKCPTCGRSGEATMDPRKYKCLSGTCNVHFFRMKPLPPPIDDPERSPP